MSGTWAAALVAAAAACLLGTSSVAQRRGMLENDDRAAGLVGTLARSRWWWAGTAASVGGLGLQFYALTLGPLVIVQTTMVASIVATGLAEWLLLGRRPTTESGVGMALTAVGLAGALLALQPTAGNGSAPSGWATVLLGVATLALIALAAARARARRDSGLGLAVATGLGYGVTAVQMKTVGALLGQGPAAVLSDPALWVAVIVGPTSVVLSQYALRRARTVALAVALIVVIDPLVGLAAGAIWFGEQVATSPAALLGTALSVAAVVVGIGLGHVGAPRRPARRRPVAARIVPREVRPCDDEPGQPS